MNFEAPLTLARLADVDSSRSCITYVVSYLLIPDLGDGTLWWKLSTRHHLRHAGRRDHPRAREGLHVDRVGPRQGGRDRRRARAARR